MTDEKEHEGANENPRERILRTAGPIFGQRGFEAATVRDIAAAADVNVASIAYYFGDKMGLYLEVIRQTKRRQAAAHPLPELTSQAAADERLRLFIAGLLARMRERDAEDWEFQLMMREMHRPTSALTEIVDEHFRPLFEQLGSILDDVAETRLAEGDRVRLALSVVGQCLYYRIGQEVLERLLPGDVRRAHLQTDQLAEHITRVTRAAVLQFAALEADSNAMRGGGSNADGRVSGIGTPR